MRGFRNPWLAAGLLLTGEILCAVACFTESRSVILPAITVGLTLILSAFALLIGQRPQSGSMQHQMEQQRLQLIEREEAFEELQTQVQDQFNRMNQDLREREKQVSIRYQKMLEWMELPAASETEAQAIPPSVGELDQRVLELLEAEAHRLFDAILANDYIQDGRFQIELLRDEMLELAGRIARVYQPDVENPLLETSPEAILRASSRICLQLLVLLDGLPLDAKRQSISDIYQYVRTAVIAYGAYRKASPYLGFLRDGMYVGRWIAGTNPLALGAWWVATQLGKEGGKAVARKWLNDQAIRVLHELVRIIGYEFANLYGPGFRYRDSQWIVAAELTEMISRLPDSQESLSEALREVSGLHLRSEYDRIYFYRCLATRRCAIQRLAEIELLTSEQRSAVVQQLEQFFQRCFRTTDNENIEAWKAGVEERFQVQMRLGRSSDSAEQIGIESLQGSLIEFLLIFKQVDDETAPGILSQCSLISELSRDQKQDFVRKVRNELPERFEPVAIDPADERVPDYLRDLARLAILVDPPESYLDSYLGEVGFFLRVGGEEIDAILNEVYQQWLEECLENTAIQPPGEVARALRCAGMTGRIEHVEWRMRWRRGSDQRTNVCLSVTKEALFVISTDPPFEVMAQSKAILNAERIHGYLIDDLRLFLPSNQQARVSEEATESMNPSDEVIIDLPGRLGTGFENRFESLIQHPLIRIDPRSSQ